MIFQDVSSFFPPTAGYLRDFLLLADSLIVFMSFEISVFFLYRSISASRKMREGKMEEERKADNVWGIFFFGFGIMRLIFIIGDFYANQIDSGLVRLDYVAIGYLSMALVACVFIYSMESRISSRSRARPITVIFLIFFAALIVAYIFKFHFDQAVAVFLGFPFLLLLLLYTARIRLKFQLGKRSFISYIFGLFGIIFGLIATSDTLIWLSNGWWWRGVGDFILVASLTALWDFFTNLPSWSEFSWKAKTQAVYLFYINSGLGVFEHHYYSSSTATPDGGQGSVVDQDLLVPGLTSIKELLERISKQPSTEPVRTYKQEDAVILLEYGQWVAAAAICKEDLKSVRRLLKKFVQRVEELFAEILPEWDGNLNDLAAVREIFQTLSSPAAFSIIQTPAMGKKLVVGLYSSVKRAIKGKNKKDRASTGSRAKKVTVPKLPRSRQSKSAELYAPQTVTGLRTTSPGLQQSSQKETARNEPRKVSRQSVTSAPEESVEQILPTDPKPRLKVLQKNIKGVQEAGDLAKLTNLYEEIAKCYEVLGDKKKATEARATRVEITKKILVDRRTELDAEAKQAERAGDNDRAAQLYGECKKICAELFRYGEMIEQDYVKLYERKQLELEKTR